MSSNAKRLERIQSVLKAAKRAESARLKAKLAEVAAARRTASELRAASASQDPVKTAAEMAYQSQRQHLDEHHARRLEAEAQAMMVEVQEMRAKLSVTLGREQAADQLATQAVKAEQSTRERRAETVPGGRRVYESSSDTDPDASSAGIA